VNIPALGFPTIPHILIALNSNILPVLVTQQRSLGKLNFTIPANTTNLEQAIPARQPAVTYSVGNPQEL
jgi:hypothetical protein